MHEQEITANPTSAKPDWIISKTQYALALCPPAPCQDCSFFVILDLAGFAVESKQADRGFVASLVGAAHWWQLGFATGKHGILTEDLNVDGRWFAGRRTGDLLDKALAGDVTSIWLDGELRFVADRPVDVALNWSADGTSVSVNATDTTWIRFKSVKPRARAMIGRVSRIHYDDLTAMAWVQVQAGKTEIIVA